MHTHGNALSQSSSNYFDRWHPHFYKGSTTSASIDAIWNLHWFSKWFCDSGVILTNSQWFCSWFALHIRTQTKKNMGKTPRFPETLSDFVIPDSSSNHRHDFWSCGPLAFLQLVPYWYTMYTHHYHSWINKFYEPRKFYPRNLIRLWYFNRAYPFRAVSCTVWMRSYCTFTNPAYDPSVVCVSCRSQCSMCFMHCTQFFYYHRPINSFSILPQSVQMVIFFTCNCFAVTLYTDKSISAVYWQGGSVWVYQWCC